jgi:transposase InsO family protein
MTHHKVATNCEHGFAVAPNHRQQDVAAAAPNQCCVAQITNSWTGEGWLYLAVVLGLFSRAVVGWSMSRLVTRDLVTKAWLMALWRRIPGSRFQRHAALATREERFPGASRRPRHRALDERHRTLRDCGHGGLLRIAQMRAGLSLALSDPTRDSHESPRRHRAVLQWPATAWLSR